VSVFPTDAQQDPNDWGVAAMAGGEVHVVRAKSSGSYDHVFGTISIATAAAPPGLARTTASGVVLLADRSLAPARTRAFLSGYCPDLDAHPEAMGFARIWTEPATGGYAIAGTLVQVR
jgi:hypothetical protein